MISAFWRRWLLPFTVLPLVPATLVNLFAGREWALLGCVLGIALPMGATWLMRRGRAGDAQFAAAAMAASAASVAFLGAEAGPIAALLLGAGASGGTQLLYTGIAEAPPPPPPAEPPRQTVTILGDGTVRVGEAAPAPATTPAAMPAAPTTPSSVAQLEAPPVSSNPTDRGYQPYSMPVTDPAKRIPPPPPKP